MNHAKQTITSLTLGALTVLGATACSDEPTDPIATGTVQEIVVENSPVEEYREPVIIEDTPALNSIPAPVYDGEVNLFRDAMYYDQDRSAELDYVVISETEDGSMDLVTINFNKAEGAEDVKDGIVGPYAIQENAPYAQEEDLKIGNRGYTEPSKYLLVNISARGVKFTDTSYEVLGDVEFRTHYNDQTASVYYYGDFEGNLTFVVDLSAYNDSVSYSSSSSDYTWTLFIKKNM